MNQIKSNCQPFGVLRQKLTQTLFSSLCEHLDDSMYRYSYTFLREVLSDILEESLWVCIKESDDHLSQEDAEL